MRLKERLQNKAVKSKLDILRAKMKQTQPTTQPTEKTTEEYTVKIHKKHKSWIIRKLN